MMPGIDGIGLLKQWRANDNILVRCSRRVCRRNRVERLESGADDYLVGLLRPPNCWRSSALLRATAVAAQINRLPSPTSISIPRAIRRRTPSIDSKNSTVAVSDATPPPPAREILQHVWNYDFGRDDNVLEVCIAITEED
jgi:DNA-binding response OmpR family regulator